MTLPDVLPSMQGAELLPEVNITEAEAVVAEAEAILAEGEAEFDSGVDEIDSAVTPAEKNELLGRETNKKIRRAGTTPIKQSPWTGSNSIPKRQS